MTDERLAQARAEAERRFGDGEDDRSASCRRNQKRFNGFMQGVGWADANHSAVEALARVRELHAPESWESYGETGSICAECSTQDSHEWWPCATYQATEVDA